MAFYSSLSYFDTVITKTGINEEQKKKIINYLELLLVHNKKQNLTGITDPKSMIDDIVLDSLTLISCDIEKKFTVINDIGSGAGIPGLLLAIASPEKEVFLVEVREKRIEFLNIAINHLNLLNCKVIPFDFKTVVRKSIVPEGLFTARASLKINDLFYLFNGNSAYKNSVIAYWGIEGTPTIQEPIATFSYTIATKKRTLYFFKKIYTSKN